MKKLLLASLLTLSVQAFAGSATFTYQDNAGVQGSKDSTSFHIQLKENFNTNFAGDISFLNNQVTPGNMLNTRLEAGITAQQKVEFVTPSLRVGLGEKYTNGNNFTYYSLEPAVAAPVGPFVAKVGWRYRNAVNTVNEDNTRTWRYSLGYEITPRDAITVRYEQMRGDLNQNGVSLGYTRNF